jgi:polyisoprenoid-binding protein YceI
MASGFRVGLLLMIVLLGALAAACSTPSGGPAAPSGGAPAGASRGAPAPSTSGGPAATAPAAGSATAAPSRETTSGPAARASGLRFTLTPGESEARFRAREQFAGASAMSDAVGATPAVEGQVVLDDTGRVNREASKVTVDLRSLRSDAQLRDRYLQQTTLLTEQYPTAEFVPTETRGLSTPLPSEGEVVFQLAGDLTLRGVTRPVVWDVRAQIAGSEATGTATTRFTLADFELPKPSVARVLSIEDTIALELDFEGTTT